MLFSWVTFLYVFRIVGISFRIKCVLPCHSLISRTSETLKTVEYGESILDFSGSRTSETLNTVECGESILDFSRLPILVSQERLVYSRFFWFQNFRDVEYGWSILDFSSPD